MESTVFTSLWLVASLALMLVGSKLKIEAITMAGVIMGFMSVGFIL